MIWRCNHPSKDKVCSFLYCVNSTWLSNNLFAHTFFNINADCSSCLAWEIQRRMLPLLHSRVLTYNIKQKTMGVDLVLPPGVTVSWLT
uniref:Uncharacterized protein n=1 Tax=Triticum urartu TaxID=4572 RepID=A0A8R7Q5D6_TRIUA